jgi:peptidoglycan/xylan/chitin deacetylase (PgdA/CDA1 family)
MYLVHGPTRSGAVCLTFDDGPDPDHTPALLDQLRCLGVVATFFVVGKRVKRYPDLVRRAVEEGHDVGHHSFTHSEPATTTADQLAEEVRNTDELLATVAGIRPRIVRPPHGKVTTEKLLRLWAMKRTVVLWNVDPKDYAMESAEQLEQWITTYHPRGGDVILLHDVHPRAGAVLPSLVARIRAAGLGFSRATEWCGGAEQ